MKSPTTGLVSPAHYGFWKALTRCFAPVIRLWEALGAEHPPGVFLFSGASTGESARLGAKSVETRRAVSGSQEDVMGATVGDRVEVQPKSVQAQGRSGTVEAVLSESPSRYQVSWDNGKSSIISATDGALRVISRSKRASSRRRATTPPKKN
jgi:Domain of unknown function (DUF1918)